MIDLEEAERMARRDVHLGEEYSFWLMCVLTSDV